ncbi:unnamed protein product [Amoebophrya sp. A120]|nr:unnamed protein product [Amoebophrya sp. A120]|eukprot:GSA120T00019231001.1
MDVTLENFDQLLPVIEQEIEAADYISIDLEMTGIRNPSEKPSYFLDLPNILYKKNREIVNAFDIMQIGICCVKKQKHDTATGRTSGGSPSSKNSRDNSPSYKLTPFNFYVLKRSIDRIQKTLVTLDTETLMFHTENKFDFQKWLQFGIGFCDSKIEEMLMAQFRQEAASFQSMSEALAGTAQNNKKQDFNVGGGITLERKDDRDWFENLWTSEIKPFFDKENSKTNPEENKFKLPNMNAFRAKFIRQQLARQYPDSYVDSYTDSQAQYAQTQRVVYRSVTLQEKEKLEKEKTDREVRKFEERKKYLRARVGFRHIWSKIKLNGCPVILHNGFFDLLFLFHNLETPLPTDLKHFRREFVKRVPNPILDTKIPSDVDLKLKYGEQELPFSSLEEVHNLLTKFHPEFIGKRFSVVKSLQELQKQYLELNGNTAETAGAGEKLVAADPILPEDEKYHDAGFDALQTAKVFLGLTTQEKFTCEPNVLPLSGRHLFRVLLQQDSVTSNGSARFAAESSELHHSAGLEPPVQRLIPDPSVEERNKGDKKNKRISHVKVFANITNVGLTQGAMSGNNQANSQSQHQQSSNSLARLDFNAMQTVLGKVLGMEENKSLQASNFTLQHFRFLHEGTALAVIEEDVYDGGLHAAGTSDKGTTTTTTKASTSTAGTSYQIGTLLDKLQHAFKTEKNFHFNVCELPEYEDAIESSFVSVSKDHASSTKNSGTSGAGGNTKPAMTAGTANHVGGDHSTTSSVMNLSGGDVGSSSMDRTRSSATDGRGGGSQYQERVGNASILVIDEDVDMLTKPATTAGGMTKKGGKSSEQNQNGKNTENQHTKSESKENDRNNISHKPALYHNHNKIFLTKVEKTNIIGNFGNNFNRGGAVKTNRHVPEVSGENLLFYPPAKRLKSSE